MKVLELRAERSEICKKYFSWTNPYVVKKDTGIFGEFVTEDLPEEILRENYEIDQKMLVRLDKINNALNESDANTYIDVHGKYKCRFPMLQQKSASLSKVFAYGYGRCKRLEVEEV